MAAAIGTAAASPHMAELLAHPDMDKDFSADEFELPKGIVVIRMRDGERSTPEKSLLLLEQAKQTLLRETLEEP